jgi:hypothetical protein
MVMDNCVTMREDDAMKAYISPLGRGRERERERESSHCFQLSTPGPIFFQNSRPLILS